MSLTAAGRFFKDEKWAFVIAAALTLLMQIAEYGGWVAGIEGKILDLLLRPAVASAATPDASLIATLAIDDEAYKQCFQSTSPMNPRRVIEIVNRIAEAEPLMIGVDIITDSDQYRKLPTPAAHMKIVWIAGADQVNNERADFFHWLAGGEDNLIVRPTKVLGQQPGSFEETSTRMWAVPVFARDDDLGLRRVPREMELASDPFHSNVRQHRPSWPTKIAEAYCEDHNCKPAVEGHEVFISYSGRGPAKYRVLDLVSCSDKGVTEAPLAAEVRSRLKDKIVLIGGTFSSARDSYPTPAGREFGLNINARAIQAEIERTVVGETWRPLSILLDLLIGGVIVFFFWFWNQPPRASVRLPMAASALLLALTVIASLLLFRAGFIWVSFVGVAFGVVLHQLVEVWREDPKPHGHHASH